MSAGFWVNYLIALVVVALLLCGLYAIVRGLARGRLVLSANRRLVTVLESTMLGQHATVHVVKVGGRYFFIGGGNAGLSTLAELPAEEVDVWLSEQRAAFSGPRSSLANAIKTLRGKS